MKHSPLRRISPARAAVRPSMDSARGFGPLDGAQADSCVGEGRHSLDAQHEEWLRQQYLRDLETLDRIERQLEERQGMEFFAAMGDLHATQGGRT